ncbi:MAG: hypothetical protein NZM05_11895 [Chloroherpetonaceae bacterium]|nr:hypothetical protein [Chloroherpetonaceae bacterium]MCS7212534.1 hypothetical protein [Chloroherpetonaceae bacterium]
MLALLLCSLCSCQRPSEPPAAAREPEASVSLNGVIYTLRAARAKFGVGDTITGVFEMWNNSAIRRTFFFLSQQHLALEVQYENGEVADAMPVQGRRAANMFELASNQRRVYPFAFLPRHPKTKGALPAGTYWLCAYLVENNSPKVRLKITIE